jgi:hypothetical protein
MSSRACADAGEGTVVGPGPADAAPRVTSGSPCFVHVDPFRNSP